MINFVNTEILREDMNNVNVMVFTNNYQRALNLIEDMINGETVIKSMVAKNEIRYIVKRDKVSINISWLPLTSSARGHRSHYSFVDKSIIEIENGTEVFNSLIYCKTIDYNVKPECRSMFEPRLFLF